MVNDDLKYMQRAFELSLKGSGRVNPNPMVGAVLVRNGKVIGEGYHEVFGGNHAEVNAINAAGDVRGATLYVTLEPCNHKGKTPPCTQRIISEKIERVVIGMDDPNPDVEGHGAEILSREGIRVTNGVLSGEIAKANEAFIKHVRQKMPFCTLKTAMTLDGKIATAAGESKWITGEKARAKVHELRHSHMAIMVGAETVLKDDPELTDRSGHTQKGQPLRIVVDSRARVPLTARAFDRSLAPSMVAHTEKAPEKKLNQLHQWGVRTIACPEKDGGVDLTYLFRRLGREGIDSILLEGGGSLNFSALREGIVDKVCAFVAPKIIGGREAITPVEGTGVEKLDEAVGLQVDKIERFGEDILIEAYIKSK